MQVTKNSQTGNVINITYTFDDDTTWTVDLAVQPYAQQSTDENGKAISVMIDPAASQEALTSFLRMVGEGYLAGKAQETAQNASVEFDNLTL